MAAVDWSWQDTQALMQRLQQPTAATVAAEYDNINRANRFMLVSLPECSGMQPQVPLPPTFAALVQRWCGMVKPLILVLRDANAIMRDSRVVLGTGMLLSLLSNFLGCWVEQAPNEKAEAAIRQQIAQHAADLAPLMAPLMLLMAAAMKESTARRHRIATKPETADEAAAAAHVRDYFPHHPDISLGLHLLSLWRTFAINWPGKLLVTSSSSSSSSSRNRGSSSSSGSSLQQTVLPACELAVTLLETWPPNPPGAAANSSSSNIGLPDGAIPRSSIASVLFMISGLVHDAIRSELLTASSPFSAADAKFAKQLSASAAVQHLMLLHVGFTCHVLHKQLHGLSPVTVKDVAAAVTGSSELAAAAAAAEAGQPDSKSSKQQPQQQQQQQQQQQYIAVPAHHTKLLDLLLAPSEHLETQYCVNQTFSADSMLGVLSGVSEFVLMGVQPPGTQARVEALPKVAVELCAPLHCMLAEAVALAPGSAAVLHMVLMLMSALEDVYFEAKLGALPPTAAAVGRANVGYTGALAASLQLLGPAVLYAHKHGSEGDREMPPGGGGCPLDDDGAPLKGALVRDAIVNLFGSVTVRIGNTQATQHIVTAAFEQRPFTAAAVCEAAVRGAARHNQVPSGAIRMFASMSTDVLAPAVLPNGSSSSSSGDVAASARADGITSSGITAAAVSDSSTRDSLLLQFELITTQLKYAAAHCGGTQVFSSILHHVLPNGKTLLRMGKLVGRSVGISSSPGDSPSSITSSSAQEQAARLQTMTPWIALCGRYLYFAGSQLILAVDDPAAGQMRGLNEDCQGPIQQALAVILAVLLMVGYQIHQLQLLQPEGTFVLHGPADKASKQLYELLDGKLAIITQKWEVVLKAWTEAEAKLAHILSAAEARGQNPSSLAWGFQLQQLVRASVPKQLSTELRDAGAAVVAEFPVKLCCNNPGCTAMGKVGEMRLGSTCTGCGAARYCGKACQGVAWKAGHSKVCKRITKAAAAAAAAAP